jgi:hypothetical protein
MQVDGWLESKHAPAGPPAPSVDIMIGSYRNLEHATPMERLRVTRTHADGAVLRCAYHGLKSYTSRLDGLRCLSRLRLAKKPSEGAANW